MNASNFAASLIIIQLQEFFNVNIKNNKLVKVFILYDFFSKIVEDDDSKKLKSENEKKLKEESEKKLKEDLKNKNNNKFIHSCDID